MQINTACMSEKERTEAKKEVCSLLDERSKPEPVVRLTLLGDGRWILA